MNAKEFHVAMPQAGDATELLPTTHAGECRNSPCSRCEAERICQMPALASGGLVSALDTQIGVRAVRAGRSIYRSGDTFRNLYVPRSGICKITRVDQGGREQITGFKISGECFGTDGIASGRHESNAVALVDMQVCTIPFLRTEALADAHPEVHRGMERMLSKEILDKDALLMLVTGRNAEQRVAAFLLDIGSRFAERTANPAIFPLCINRKDIGTYLGLTLETVSRTFSRFRQQRLISWEGRVIHLHDIGALRRM